MHQPTFMYFPWLHPALVPSGLPVPCAVLDPGIAVQGYDVPRWRPQWPYTDDQIRRIIAEFLRQASEAARPADLAARIAAGAEDFYTDTALDIRSQLTGGAPVQDPEQGRLRQIQVLLALEFTREEAVVDLIAEQTRLAQARHQWKASLGVDADDLMSLEVPEVDVVRPAQELDWRQVLWAMDAVVPGQIPFVVADAAVAAQWREAGVPWTMGEHGRFVCHLDDAVVRALGVAFRGSPSGRMVVMMTQPECEAV